MRTSAPAATMVPQRQRSQTGEHWPFFVTRPIVRHVLLVWASRRYGEAVMNSEQKRLKESRNRSAHWNRWVRTLANALGRQCGYAPCVRWMRQYLMRA
jgi:hypothetical protein